MVGFPYRPAARRAYRMAWMIALYAAFVTSVAVSADRDALLAQVQAMTEGPDAAAPATSATAEPRRREVPAMRASVR